MSKRIIATNETIKQIVDDEIRRLGFNADLNHIDTSQVTNMSYLFQYRSNFNGDISSWNTSNVTSMRSMFVWAESFNCDISNWDVSNVTNMGLMFLGCFIDDKFKCKRIWNEGVDYGF